MEQHQSNGLNKTRLNSNAARRSLNNGNKSYNNGSMHNDPRLSQSNYAAMLKLTPDVGSVEEGRRLFDFLVKPLPVAEFMEKCWEKNPLRVNRKSPKYYKDLLSLAAIDNMLRRNQMEYIKNIDVQFKDDNEAATPIGRASPHTLRQFYNAGSTITILNAETFSPTIHSMNETLQEYFQCSIESSVHLGSKNSYGYAPRYDDVEIFILQIEGRRHWRIYKPTHRNETFSREDPETESLSMCSLDLVLNSGDLLYIPRGHIYEATTSANSHSLHITLTIKRQTYGDLLEVLLPMAVKDAINANLNLRKGLPLDIWQNMGVVNSDNCDRERDLAIAKIRDSFETICRYVIADTNLDNAVDQLALRYQRNSLPPKLTPEEELRTVYGANMITANGSTEFNRIEWETQIRLIRANLLRMIWHESGIRVYYSSDNLTDHQGLEENYLEVDHLEALAVEILIKTYPIFIKSFDLQVEKGDKILNFVQNLWERGILMTNVPWRE